MSFFRNSGEGKRNIVRIDHVENSLSTQMIRGPVKIFESFIFKLNTLRRAGHYYQE